MSKLVKAGVAGAVVLGLMAGGAAMAQDKPASGGGDNQFGQPSSSGSTSTATTNPGDLITGNALDAIVASMERNGLKVELTEDSGGDPRIRSTDEDNPFSVHFYSCTDNTDCGVIQFSAGWNLKNGITLAKIEEWNATKLWGQAYRDEDKDPWLAMTVNLKGGVTVENFDDTVDWWRVVSGDFEKHIGWDAD